MSDSFPLDPGVAAPRIFVAGHRGMVGSAVVRALRAAGVRDEAILTRSHAELDLTRQQAVEDFFAGKATLREDGRLSDLAPTLLELLGLPVPAQMSGKTLIKA